ncbi:RNA methyltransferase [Niabella insulamsoli]|uniref:TrmH family RNA methyltransferase n=1 Tax=Niabella insulamsoli TaxID=3144874 RepID=UPI0031FC9F97
MLSKSEVKYIQSLSQKKFRAQAQAYVVEGPKIVAEALLSPLVEVEQVFALSGWLEANQKLTKNVSLTVVDEQELQRISQLKTANQALAVVKKNEGNSIVADQNAVSLALDGIQDPGNLGTIIRIADWFGIDQVICSEDCADVYNPKVVQASMGSIFRVNMAYVDLKDWLAGKSDVPLFGAALHGKPLSSFSKLHKGIIVIGNESKGIRPEILDLVQEKLTIERRGQAESLNAAVATGIILSHLV